MELKKSASKAFLVSGGILVASMFIVTIISLFTGELEGKDLFAAPLLGFYIALGAFVLAFPIVFLFFLFRSRGKGGAENEL